MITLKNILVATDFSDESQTALTYGRDLARTFYSTLHVLHIVGTAAAQFGTEAYSAVLPDLQRDIEDAARRQLEGLLNDDDRMMLHARAVVRTSNRTAAAVVEYARDLRIDLIVIGTHGRGAVAHLVMGSVAEPVVRTAPCPVLAVRHPEREFVTPDALVAAARAHGGNR
jgi:nucleotide-binding universal stress UspA family protein